MSREFKNGDLVTAGDLNCIIRLSDECSAQIHKVSEQLDALNRQQESVPSSLVGALAAAVQITKPVSRRRLFLPWSK